MKLSEKIKAIRDAEGLSQTNFCEIIGLSANTLRKYESGSYEPSGLNLMKITLHPRFKKYTLWLMSDSTAPEAGQVAPAIAHIGQAKTTLDR
ncbi:TPA: helix-turn-helix transcriptional regulator [Yersinia enterocolitica]|uniref:helix-turn-helix domain-containing protein n=1 Tax=Yersinia TaxID=629 RepID=UPI0025AA3E43|nr:helix-turn-helix transcriptional regulator [Yersinia rohdei]HDL6748256.1 helix-turn-helix transcriptional regulator [Yersinia enterocolitica]MDN0094146.1 helix-turn-helix transcriptional regulator [Yersinia rohdei]HDL8094915.1 helix-turn-helix transcriptional regulator [Yersinia enterocolitica]HDL8482810.1 helix-turn-helix transcriptional regulator [Yersinia enterocolitica]HDV7162395.1 helix-turn-helix transcriptional regulator [Yersinia enterocolitica]